jgi:beta-lactamase superfamily II metal-dependent hydrolase
MTLTIRAYNVLFGDCILITWHEQDGPHHAWVDFGNFHNDANAVFASVYEDVLKRTGGNIDLVVVTHRHLDHLEGFHSLRKRFAKDFSIDRLWHAHVSKGSDDVFELADQSMRALLPASALDVEAGLLGRIYHNNHYITTKDRMHAVADELPAQSAHAVHRETKLSEIKPAGLKRMKVEVLAPERDSSIYLRPLEEALSAVDSVTSSLQRASSGGSVTGRRRRVTGDELRLAEWQNRLEGLADFARLRRHLRSGGLNFLAAVDRTRNNTSIVLRLTYGATKVLLTGDAEEGSWETIKKKKPRSLEATVVKVGHHGSINASPSWSFEKVMVSRKEANAVILSTDPSRFTGENEVPKREVLEGWQARLTSTKRFLRTDKVRRGKSVSLTIEE